MITDKQYKEKIEIHKNTQLGKDYMDTSICISLSDKILKSESTILNLGKPNYPDVDSSTITARHSYYNLLDFNWEEFIPIKQKIVENSSKLLGGESFYIKMWANIFRNGQCIRKHMHHPSPIIESTMFKQNVFKTICGHLFLRGDYPSETIYHFDKGVESIPNKTGDFHFFSCIVPHETLPFEGTIRIGIAFDIYTSDFFKSIGTGVPYDVRLIK